MRISKAILITAGLLATASAVAQQTGVADPRAMLPAPGGGTPRGRPTAMGARLTVRDFGAACDGIADDSLALARAGQSLEGSNQAVLVPGDCRLNLGPAARLAGTPAVLTGMALVGDGGRDSGNSTGRYGAGGSTVLLTDEAAPAIITRGSLRIAHLVFFWPGMTEASTTADGGVPPPLPALIAGPGTAAVRFGQAYTGAVLPLPGLSEVRLEDDDIINAFDVIDVSGDVSGGFSIDDVRAFWAGVFLKLGHMPTESEISNSKFTPNAYYNALSAGPTYNLENWAASHAEVVRAVGDGTATTRTTRTVDGIDFHNNVVFGIGFAFRAIGGFLNGLVVADSGFDGVPHWLSLERGGGASGRWSGGVNTAYTLVDNKVGDSNVTAAFYQAPDASPDTNLAFDGLFVSFTTGALLDFEAASVQPSVTLHDVTSLATVRGTGASADAIHWAAAGRLTLQDSQIGMSQQTAGACLDFAGPLQMLMVTGNTFVTCPTVIAYSGSVAPSAATVAINQSIGTAKATYGGSKPNALPNVLNAWDRPAPR